MIDKMYVLCELTREKLPFPSNEKTTGTGDFS